VVGLATHFGLARIGPPSLGSAVELPHIVSSIILLPVVTV
jgi:hypothetical protein